MEYKYTEVSGKKYIEVDEKGNPVVIGDDEKEFGLDAIHLLKKVPDLQAEAKKHREAKEDVESKLKSYADIDPAKAKDALEKLKTIDLNKMVSAGKLDEIRAEVTQAFKDKMQNAETAYQERLAELENLSKQKEADIRRLTVGSKFASSSFIKDKTTFPTPAAAEAMFGSAFDVVKDDSGNIVTVAKMNGKEIISRSKPPNYADFDEAVQILIDNHPDRDLFIKPSQNAGSGNQRKIRMSTEDFMKLSPVEMAKIALQT